MALIDELKEVKLECEAEMAALINSSDEEFILRDLKAYEEELRKSYAEKKSEALKEKELEIKAISNLITREETRMSASSATESTAESVEVSQQQADSYYANV